MLEAAHMSTRFEQSLSLDLSVAARAYAVTIQALKNFQARPSAHDATSPAETGQALMRANLLVETLQARMGLAWQTAPIARFLYTQLDLVRDTLEYSRADALRGYGNLAAQTANALDQYFYLTNAMLDHLAQQIDQRAVDWPLNKPTNHQPSEIVGELSATQRGALRSCLHALAKELLLLEGYAICASPPVIPSFTSSYDRAQVRQLLAQAHLVEACIEATGAAWAIAVPWRAALTEILINGAARSEDCAQSILRELYHFDHPCRQEAATLVRAAHLAFRAALEF
jgi:hypothetical protein